MNTEQIVDVLTSALHTDPQAINDLMKVGVVCNAEMLVHPAIQIHTQENGREVLRCLGLINAIAAIDNKVIFAIYDIDKIIGFGSECLPTKKPPLDEDIEVLRNQLNKYRWIPLTERVPVADDPTKAHFIEVLIDLNDGPRKTLVWIYHEKVAKKKVIEQLPLLSTHWREVIKDSYEELGYSRTKGL